MIALFHVLGLTLTLVTLLLLATGGYLAALLLLWRPEGEPAELPDPLALATATLVMMTAQAIAIATALGAFGHLRLVPALAIQTTLVYGLLRLARRRYGERLAEPARQILARSWGRVRELPVLSLVALHAGGIELARGLLRPPLSWDSLMYHLYLTATWLQQGSFDLVPARDTTTAYLLMPANGSLWTWWWMAPSHGELYVNLAFLPQWLLLGLAAGGFARQLGARRHWPIATFLVLLAPTVVRFLATQYVDILLGALLVAASFFAARWLERPAWGDLALTGTAVGLAMGTKVLGLPYGLALLGLVALVALLGSDERARRTVQLGALAVITAAFGGFFYVRNLVVGGDFLALACTHPSTQDAGGVLAGFPAASSVVAQIRPLLASHELLDTFLGSLRPALADLGVGPVVVMLAAVAVALPFGTERKTRALALFATGQILAQALVWATVPYAENAHILANVRYLIGALGLLFAGATALGERWMDGRWLRLLAVAVAIQDLLMLHTAMPRTIRLALAGVLIAAAVLASSAGARRLAAARWKTLAVAAGVLAMLSAPLLARFRIADRERAFAEEYTAHLTSSRIFAAGWGWLDQNAGRGTVAVSHAPKNYFVYPAMGPFLERRAIYVHVNAAAHDNPLLYPGCAVRVDPSPEAWLENLRRQGVEWLYVARFPEFDFPVEDAWARQRPDLFELRFDHPTNRVYRFVGASSGPGAP